MPERMFTERHGFYVLTGWHASSNPADSITHYWGSQPTAVTTATEARRNIFIPKAGVITAFYLTLGIAGAGTSETVNYWIRLNATSDSHNIQVAHDASPTAGNNISDRVAVAAGDTIEIKFTAPVYATNPTGILGAAWILIQT